MATRLYWNYQIPDYNMWGSTGSWPGGGWHYAGGFTSAGQMLDTVKGGNPIARDEIFPSASGGPPVHILFYRGISRRLLPQTISGTFDAVFHARQSVATAECYTRVIVYVLDVTGSPWIPPVLGYLVSSYDETPAGANGTEWPTAGSSLTPGSRSLKAPVTLTPVTIPSDGRSYRLVVEVGCVSLRTAGTSFGASSKAGARASDWVVLPDLAPSATYVEAVPYCDLSATLLFGATEYLVSNYDVDGAIDIGPAPASFPVTAAAAGTSNPDLTYRWYRYASSADETVSVLSCNGGTPGGSGQNDSLVYSQTTVGTGPPFKTIGSATGSLSQRPLQAPTKIGGAVYVRLYLGAGVTTTVTLVVGPKNAAVGDLLINVDDSSPSIYDPSLPAGNASIWWHPDGTLSQATANLIYSELGVTLQNGMIGIPSQTANGAGAYELFIYDKPPGLALLQRVTLPDYPNSCGTDMQAFYVVSGDYHGPTTLVKIAETGTIVDTWTMSPGLGDGVKNFGVSRDGGRAYVVNNDTGAIYRHDLVADVGLGDISVPPGSEWDQVDILVLADETIVTVYRTSVDTLYHYAPDGTVLHVYMLPGTTYRIDHLSHTADDSVEQVWVWRQKAGDSQFQLVDFVAGVMVSAFTTALFDQSFRGPHDAGCAPQRFGVGSSCAFFTMMTPPPEVVMPTLTDDLASCPTPTTALVNLALARIGINQAITDLATDQTAEAAAVWLAYDETLLATLREFPWAFATGYADPLTLVTGTLTTPAAPDWQYAYRQPVDCVYARRIVRPLATTGLGRAFDPQPPDFRVGQDATGFLIYANEPDAVLEYTRRLTCPALKSEALFRSAWAWRLAHELAPSLSRLPDRTTYCWQQYQYALHVAATKNTGEVQQPPDGLPDWIRTRQHRG